MNKTKKIGIVLPPSPAGPGMIKSPPLDIANLMALLKETPRFSVSLFDLRYHTICDDGFWKYKKLNIDIFNDFKKCFCHLKEREDSYIKYITDEILKEVPAQDYAYLIFSITILEQFSLQYLAVSLCLAKQIKARFPSIKIMFYGNCPKSHARMILRNFQFVDMLLEDGNEFSMLEYLKIKKRDRIITGVCQDRKRHV